MWIKLISPRVTMRPMDSAWKTRMAPPLSLLVLGALTPCHHRVTLCDENVERLRTDDDPDLVGITVKVDTADRARAIADDYRARGIPVIVGGIHPTVCPEACRALADAVVIGEAESLWAGILEDLQNNRLQSVYRAATPPDAAAIPVPRWELLNARRYLFTNTMRIGRGCPWRCDFCYNSASNIPAGYRMKPIPNILCEIAAMRTRHVMFIDDNFIADPAAARALVRVLKPLGLTWHTAVSADIGRHEALLDEMAEAGCRSLFIGFETIDQQNLRCCHKTQNQPRRYDETIARIHACGMMVNASVVFGFDGDGPDVFDRTRHWLTANRVETMTAHILTPYPGTRLYAQLAAQGRIVDYDLAHYNTAHAVFLPLRMSRAELEDGYRKTYREFYGWRSIMARLPTDASRRSAYLQFQFLYRKFGKVTARLGLLFGMRNLARLATWMAYAPARQGGAVASSATVTAPAASAAWAGS